MKSLYSMIRSISILFAVLLVASCENGDQSPTTPHSDPRFVIFPAYVAKIKNISGTVVENVYSPNATSSMKVDYDIQTADSVAWEGVFYPDSRTTDGDTAMTVVFTAWTYTKSGVDYPCSNPCQFPANATNIRLKYDYHIIPPVVLSPISGESDVRIAKSYTWTVSSVGGDAWVSTTYQWQLSENNGATWANQAGSSSYSRTFSSGTTYNDFQLRVIATNSGKADTTTMAVTVHNPLEQVLSASIVPPSDIYCNGGCAISSPGNYTWSASVSGGTGSYSYSWRVYWYDRSEWTGPTTGSSLNMDIGAADGDFEVHLTVTSGSQQQSDMNTVCNFIYPNDNSCT